MKSRIIFILTVVVALAVAAVPVRGPVAAQEEEGPLGFQSYDFCTGEYVLEVREGAPTEGTAEVVVSTGYSSGEDNTELDSETHELDWTDPQEMSGTLLVEYPDGAETLYFKVTVDGEPSHEVSIPVDELACEEPGDGEEPVTEEPGDGEEPVTEEPGDEVTLPGCDVTIPLEGAVVGRFEHTAETYWAPDFNKKTAPEVLIPWNTTLWTFGVDESGQFRKVVLNCTYLWVPVETMGPNFDEVWGGAPLPMTVVD